MVKHLVSNLKIEAIQETDLSDVVDLLQNLSIFRPKLSGSLFWDHSKQDNVFSCVGRVNGEVVAYASLVVELKIRGGRLGHIEDVIVRPDKQNRGIGSKMIEHVLEVARQQDCYKVVLASRSESRAFYEFLGFHTHSNSFELFLEGSP